MAANNAPEQPNSEGEPPRSDAAAEFRDAIVSVIQGLGRDGVDLALETLFAISDVVLDNRHCDRHSMWRIRGILDDAMVVNMSSEEESTEQESG